MNANLQAVINQIKVGGYYKWIQCFCDETAFQATLWEKNGKSRIYINDADRNGYGYFDLNADGKYIGTDEAFALSVIEQIVREANETEEAAKALIGGEDDEWESPANDDSATPYHYADPVVQIELVADAQPELAWIGGGVGYVNAEKAEEIRNGKPYHLLDIDVLRLVDLRDRRPIDGNPQTDPFIIAMQSRGYISENPDYTRYAELSKQAAAQGHGFNVKWSDRMDVYVGFGGGNMFRRWVITDAGAQFTGKLV